MNEKEFLKKLDKIMKKFDKQIYVPLVDLINEYKESENAKSYYSLSYKPEIEKLDNFALLTAWVIDRLDGKIGCIGDKTYRGSLTKKIRKALGYTL